MGGIPSVRLRQDARPEHLGGRGASSPGSPATQGRRGVEGASGGLSVLWPLQTVGLGGRPGSLCFGTPALVSGPFREARQPGVGGGYASVSEGDSAWRYAHALISCEPDFIWKKDLFLKNVIYILAVLSLCCSDRASLTAAHRL